MPSPTGAPLTAPLTDDDVIRAPEGSAPGAPPSTSPTDPVAAAGSGAADDLTPTAAEAAAPSYTPDPRERELLELRAELARVQGYLQAAPWQRPAEPPAPALPPEPDPTLILTNPAEYHRMTRERWRAEQTLTAEQLRREYHERLEGLQRQSAAESDRRARLSAFYETHKDLARYQPAVNALMRDPDFTADLQALPWEVAAPRFADKVRRVLLPGAPAAAPAAAPPTPGRAAPPRVEGSRPRPVEAASPTAPPASAPTLSAALAAVQRRQPVGPRQARDDRGRFTEPRPPVRAFR